MSLVAKRMCLLALSAVFLLTAVTACGYALFGQPDPIKLSHETGSKASRQSSPVESDMAERPWTKRNLQHQPPIREVEESKSIEPAEESAPQEPPILPPNIAIVQISRSPNHEIAVVRNNDTQEMATGFTGETVFQSRILAIDFENDRVQVEYQGQSFWIGRSSTSSNTTSGNRDNQN